MGTLSDEQNKIEVTITLYRNTSFLGRLRKYNAEEQMNYLKEIFSYHGLDPASIVECTLRHRQNKLYTMEVDFQVTLRLKLIESENRGFQRIIDKLRGSPDICITPNNMESLDVESNERFGGCCNIRLSSISLGTILQNKFFRHSPSISSVKNDDPMVSFKLDSQRTMELYFLLGNYLYCMELKYKRDIDKKIVVCMDNTSTRIYFQLLFTPKIFIAEDNTFSYQTRVSTNISPETYLNSYDDTYVVWNRAREIPGCSSETLGLCTALELNLSDSSCPKDRLMSLFKEFMERQYTISFGQFEMSPWMKYTRRWKDIFAFVENLHGPFTFNVHWALKVLYSKGYIAIDYVENHPFFWMSIKNFATEDPEQLELALYEVMVMLDDDRSIDLYKALCKIYKDKTLKKKVTDIDNIKKIRMCYVTPTRLIFFPPMDILENRILREYNPDYALRVTYRDDDMTRIYAKNSEFYDEVIRTHLSNGIHIHNRIFEFLACSNSQLRGHGVWFYAQDPDNITAKKIREEAGILSHIDCIASYVARLGQCFSSSERSVTSIKDLVTEEDDITVQTDKGEYTFSDGTGRVSQSLSKKICSKLNKTYDRIPSLFQIRYGGCKGTISVDNTLLGDAIIMRKSMVKFHSPCHDLEIVKVASPSRLHLNHQSIMLLEHHGVSKNVFLKLQESALDTYLDMLLKEHTAAKVLDGHASMGRPLSHKNLLASGISLTTDPYFRRVLKLILHNSLSTMKSDGRIDLPTDKGRNLIGCMDEYRVLKYGEVHVKITKMEAREETRTITGPVIITKFPAVHPGDMRRFEAVEKPELAHLIDCVVFPQQGSRSHPSEMAGSDLDGDEFFVTWLPEFLSAFSLKNEEPLDYLPVQKNRIGRPVVVSDIYQFISDYIKNDQLGPIANAHKAIADKDGLNDKTAVQLAKKFAEAVDFAKTGKTYTLDKDEQACEYPDFMEKHGVAIVYESNKALGHMYRSVSLLDDLLEYSIGTEEDAVNWAQIDCGQPSDKYLHDAERVYQTYCNDVFEMMHLYGVSTEAELISGNVIEFHRRFMEREDKFATRYILKKRIHQLREKFRGIFFKEFHINPAATMNFKMTADMTDKAYAWYFVAYQMSTSDDKTEKILSFPWLVSDVLCTIPKPRIRDSSPFINEIGCSLLEIYNQYVSYHQNKICEPANDTLRRLSCECPASYPLLYILDEWCRIVNMRDVFLSIVEILLGEIRVQGVDICENSLMDINSYRDYLVECSSDAIDGCNIGQILMNVMKIVSRVDKTGSNSTIRTVPIRERRTKENLRIHALRAKFSLAVDNSCQGLLNKAESKKRAYTMREQTVLIPFDILKYFDTQQVRDNVKANFKRLATKMDLYLHEISITVRKKKKRQTGSIFFRGSFKTVKIFSRTATVWLKGFQPSDDEDYFIELYKIYTDVNY